MCLPIPVRHRGKTPARSIDASLTSPSALLLLLVLRTWYLVTTTYTLASIAEFPARGFMISASTSASTSPTFLWLLNTATTQVRVSINIPWLVVLCKVAC